MLFATQAEATIKDRAASIAKYDQRLMLPIEARKKPAVAVKQLPLIIPGFVR